MERNDETYRDHEIRVAAQEDRPGYWSWSFVVDERVESLRLTSFQKTAEAALAKGARAARARADELDGLHARYDLDAIAAACQCHGIRVSKHTSEVLNLDLGFGAVLVLANLENEDCMCYFDDEGSHHTHGDYEFGLVDPYGSYGALVMDFVEAVEGLSIGEVLIAELHPKWGPVRRELMYFRCDAMDGS